MLCEVCEVCECNDHTVCRRPHDTLYVCPSCADQLWACADCDYEFTNDDTPLGFTLAPGCEYPRHSPGANQLPLCDRCGDRRKIMTDRARWLLDANNNEKPADRVHRNSVLATAVVLLNEYYPYADCNHESCGNGCEYEVGDRCITFAGGYELRPTGLYDSRERIIQIGAGADRAGQIVAAVAYAGIRS